MKSTTKTIVILAVTVFAAIFVTIYTSSAYDVASHVYEDENGALYWGVETSFLPWPTRPTTGLTISVGVFLSEINVQYYRYIIQSGVLVALTVVSWLIVIWRAVKLARNRPKQSSPNLLS